jgi:hypothetical protein
MKLSAQLLEDFNNGERSDSLRFCFGDEVVVKDGIYRGRSGSIECLDITRNEPSFLVDFGDGTDEFIEQPFLELLVPAE